MTHLNHLLAASIAWLAITGAASAGQCGYDYCWGAVAVGPHGATGFSYSHVTEKNAHQVAIEGCNGVCARVRTFYNACGAIASGRDGAWGWATGRTKLDAQSGALAQCGQHGKDCQIQVWSCSP
ncbi:DUF4189 domain-containing protein [Pontibaca salina]|uniref:DUF4189 domain-containing protein n=1 Tax=Pontibaca salina TaxID=2795731 RepID=A0A934HM84_9RHOB|nr:DUF4189 domain-containing protein [Pontibaca salina]MBI6630799.1 DUF4189 domain-containing protein [Pontibaca salina]